MWYGGGVPAGARLNSLAVASLPLDARDSRATGDPSNTTCLHCLSLPPTLLHLNLDTFFAGKQQAEDLLKASFFAGHYLG